MRKPGRAKRPPHSWRPAQPSDDTLLLVTVPLRTTLLFFTAYALNTTAHELARAVAAYSLGLRSTLFQYYANIDFTGPDPKPRVLVAVAGPVFSLVFGLVCWLVYRKIRLKASKLSWLYLAIFGISIFLGNIFSTSFTGDFATAATLLNVDPTIRLLMTILGLALSAAFLSAMGQELVKWAPHGSGRTMAMVHMILLPATLGTAAVILAFLPLPAQFIVGWLTTALFWLFAAAGAYVASEYATGGGNLQTRPLEYVAAAVALAVVRVLVVGISLAP
jgi:hypothetical protein